MRSGFTGAMILPIVALALPGVGTSDAHLDPNRYGVRTVKAAGGSVTDVTVSFTVRPVIVRGRRRPRPAARGLVESRPRADRRTAGRPPRPPRHRCTAPTWRRRSALRASAALRWTRPTGRDADGSGCLGRRAATGGVRCSSSRQARSTATSATSCAAADPELPTGIVASDSSAASTRHPAVPIPRVRRNSASPARNSATPEASSTARAVDSSPDGWPVASWSVDAASTMPSRISRCQ